MGIILERTGDSRWYIKHADVAEGAEMASLLALLTAEVVEDEDNEDLASVLR